MSRRVLGGLVTVAAALGASRVQAQGIDLLMPLAELEARAARDSLDPGAQYDAALGYWFKRRYDDADNDGDIRAALPLFARLPELLAATAH